MVIYNNDSLVTVNAPLLPSHGHYIVVAKKNIGLETYIETSSTRPKQTPLWPKYFHNMKYCTYASFIFVIWSNIIFWGSKKIS